MNIEELEFGRPYIYVKYGKSKRIVQLTEINKNVVALSGKVTHIMAAIPSYKFTFEIISDSKHTFLINLNESDVLHFVHDKQKYEAQFLNTIKDIYE